MRIEFPYQGIEGVEIPGGNLLGIFTPNTISKDTIGDIRTLLEESLASPIGAKPIEDLVRPGSRVLILSDDNTRPTPVQSILDVLLPRLAKLGVQARDITIMIATGTHRPLKEQELESKLGRRVLANHKVLNHHFARPGENVYYGTTSRGIEVWGNRILKEYDFIIGLGHIVPHRVAGFSGGGKIVQPGVSNEKTTGETHWLSALVPGADLLGQSENLVRHQIDESARLMKLDYVINVVQDLTGAVVGVFSGDAVLAHRKGCELSRKVYGVAIPQADIVITDSYPADVEMWQAAKGIYSAELVVKNGGIIILATPCPEGVATTHPEVELFGYRSLSEVEDLLQLGKIRDKSVAAHLVHVGRVLKEKADIIVVSPGIPHEVKKRLGFTPSNTVQEALTVALAKLGHDASIAVMLHSGEILPLRG